MMDLSILDCFGGWHGMCSFVLCFGARALLVVIVDIDW